jgi:hypothetical protein
LKVIYPEHHWQNFSPKTSRWNDVKVQREFLENLGKELGISKLEDWNNVSSKTVMDAGGWFIRRYYRGLPEGISLL